MNTSVKNEYFRDLLKYMGPLLNNNRIFGNYQFHKKI